MHILNASNVRAALPMTLCSSMDRVCDDMIGLWNQLLSIATRIFSECSLVSRTWQHFLPITTQKMQFSLSYDMDVISPPHSEVVSWGVASHGCGLIVNPSSTVKYREHPYSQPPLIPLLGHSLSNLPTCSYIYQVAQPHWQRHYTLAHRTRRSTCSTTGVPPLLRLMFAQEILSTSRQGECADD